MCWERESEYLQDVMPAEENWPEDLDSINDRLITVSHSTTIGITIMALH